MARRGRRFCKCRRLGRGPNLTATRTDAFCDRRLTCTHRYYLRLDNKQALCDLTDVSSKEKHLFSLWNAFMRKKPILSQIQLPSQLRTFVQEHSSTIAEHGLEEELIAHVTNMWVEGVIGRWNMLECMRIYNDFVLAQSRASP